MAPFIRATEIWLPSAAGNRLEWGGGLYGPLEDFKAISRQTTFDFDEGLPGRAWAARHPIILKEFQNSYFRRAIAAERAGLTCGIALPVFAGETLKAVIVFFCSETADDVGAIEIWSSNESRPLEIGLADAYYAAAELVEWTPRHIKFRSGFGPAGHVWATSYGAGSGLPGCVWQSGRPCLVDEAFKAAHPPQWVEALPVGISAGVGIPSLHDPRRSWVTTFLSSPRTPIARRFEIWVPDDRGRALTLKAGNCATSADIMTAYKGVQLVPGDGLIGTAYRTLVPAVSENLRHEAELLRQSLARAGLTSALALPIMDKNGNPVAVVAWYS